MGTEEKKKKTVHLIYEIPPGISDSELSVSMFIMWRE